MNENLMEKLNKEQFKAVVHDQGPLLIVAGAGTGKTTVITQRIAYLIEQGKAKPDEILALTFTEKAAGEMEERVDRLLPIGYVDLWISTFHSFGEKILADHGIDIGLDGGFKLLNEFEQWILIKNNFDKFDLDYYRPMGNPTKFIHSLTKHFSRLKDEDISPAMYLSFAEELRQNLDGMLNGAKKKSSRNFQFSISNFKTDNKEIAEQEINRINEAANAYHAYQQLLLDNNALDFGDLINYTLKLFRDRPKILEQYRRQFKYILLDEFQDTNWAQYELIKLLASPKNNLVVVGDDDQSVYKFRGASISNIMQFKSDFKEAEELVLTQNYRNTQDILDLSYKFIQLNNPNRLEYQLNKQSRKIKLNKKLISNKKTAGEIEVIEGADLEDEIKKVVEKIAEIKINDKEASWSDFAVLVRANDSAKEICATLEAAGLPYQFLASRGLYSKPIILDVISYLKMLDNYHESAALYRVLNIPVFGFKYQELVNLNYWAKRKSWSLYEVLRGVNALKLGPEIRKKAAKVLALIEKHTALVKDKNTLEIFLAFMQDSAYLKHITQSEDQKSKELISYLNQFIKRIQAFEANSDDKSVKRFLFELNLEIEAGDQGTLSPDTEAGPDAIKVLTIHAAKGLEFKYVFIANMVDKRFPTIARKEQIEIPDQLVKEEVPDGDIHLEEERRLFYVAATRAESGLYFSWAQNYGGARKKKPSRFLVECNLIDPSKISAPQKPDPKDLNKPSQAAKAIATETFYKIPTYLSFTQLAAFSNCPYQYRFAHLLKVPISGKPQFSFGKTMHAALQKLFLAVNEKKRAKQANLFGEETGKAGNANITLEEAIGFYKSSWIDEWYFSKKQKQEYFEMGKSIIKDFYEKHHKAWPSAILLEKGFSLKIKVADNIYTIRGTIDRVDENEGRIKIIDYKTGKPKEKLTFEDKEQLLIYQLAARDIFNYEVASLAFYYLENNTELEFLGSDDELLKVKAKIADTINEINKQEFPPKPGPLCKFCDFFHICEYRQK